MRDWKDETGYCPASAGELLANGREDEATEMMSRFAERGSVVAMVDLADYNYDRGSFDESTRWIELAENSARNGCIDDLAFVSSGYRRGLGGLDPMSSTAKAVALFEELGRSGNAEAARHLAYWYAEGINGVQRNSEVSDYWLRSACRDEVGGQVPDP